MVYMTDIEAWALDQVAIRSLVDELIALHLTDGIPEPESVEDGALTFII